MADCRRKICKRISAWNWIRKQWRDNSNIFRECENIKFYRLKLGRRLNRQVSRSIKSQIQQNQKERTKKTINYSTCLI
jgi:hypothetical protein